MDVFIGALGVVVLGGKSNVVLVIGPHCERVPVRYEDPLPNVEFTMVKNEGIFDVLLNHPLGTFVVLNVGDNLRERFADSDASPS